MPRQLQCSVVHTFIFFKKLFLNLLLRLLCRTLTLPTLLAKFQKLFRSVVARVGKIPDYFNPGIGIVNILGYFPPRNRRIGGEETSISAVQ